MEVKLHDKIINDKLKEEIERGGDWPDSQFGFRKGRSTMPAIKELMRKEIEKRESTHY